MVSDIALEPDSIHVGQVADLPTNLGGQVGLDILGPPFLEEGILPLAVWHDEFQAIDHVADARGLLGGAEGEHRLVDGGHSTGQGGHTIPRGDLDRQVGQRGTLGERS